MLAIWGLITIVGMILAIASRRVSPLIALLLFPVVTSLAAGFGLENLRCPAGLQAIAPVVAMFLFAILFWNPDRYRPCRAAALHWLFGESARTLFSSFRHRPAGTSAPSGWFRSVVFLVVIPTMLALPGAWHGSSVLACAVSMAAGVNFLPVDRTTLRAASALHTSPLALFRPLIPVQIIGLIYVFAVAFYLGHKEQKRIGPTVQEVQFEQHFVRASIQSLAGAYWQTW